MKAHFVNSGRTSGVLRQFPAALLSRFEPGLFVDVGAAVGRMTKLMLKANPASRVIAYEPFAGNLTYLQQLADADPRIAVRPVAVADHDGSARLYVASVVATDDETIGTRTGASNIGHLTRNRPARDRNVHEVPVVRLDSEIHSAVRFLKMDIQGSEYKALKGARTLIETKGVDFLYIEFNGDLRVLRFLDAHDYVVFDCVYLAWPSRWAPRNLFRKTKTLRLPRWKTVREIYLSTGVWARLVWPRVPFRSFTLYCAWFAFMRLFVCGLQTDLFCVHRSQIDAFARMSREARLQMLAHVQARGAGGAAQVSAD